MKSPKYKVKIGIVGCGAIGSRMVQTIIKNKEFAKDCKVSAIFDVDQQKAAKLASKFNIQQTLKKNLNSVIEHCDCLVEAVNAENTEDIIKLALINKKTVLSMSVGKLLNADYLFKLAKKNKCYILLPSGAIAGIDAIKAASLAQIKKITLISRKPPTGFIGNKYIENIGLDLKSIKKETIIFEGQVDDAVKHFPQNINVAATIALACQNKKLLTIKIISSPAFKNNSHEINVEGDFGTIVTKTVNEICPDNPKTSYLAVLSGLKTLHQYCTGILIGT